MDILLLAAAIFGLSSFFSRAKAPCEIVYSTDQQVPSRSVKTNSVYRYSKEQLIAVNSSPVPAPDLLTLRRLAHYGLNP